MSESNDIGTNVIDFARALAPYITKDFDFSDWSERQKRVFLADVDTNIRTGRLKNLSEQGQCIKAFPSIQGKVDYIPTEVKENQAGVVRVGISGQEMSRGEFNSETGIGMHGPDYGWLILEDKPVLETTLKQITGKQ